MKQLCIVAKTEVINTQNNQFEFQTLSQGKDKLLCFNGYGKLTTDFQLFQPFFTKQFHTIAVNLPYHGQSKWTLQNNAQEKWESFLEQIGWENEKINILAYSIGARYLYSILAFFPEKINTVYLIAPDGITPNPISHFATFTKTGKWLMDAFIQRAGFVLWVLKVLNSINILAEADYAFFLRKINSREDRKRLQRVWKEVYSTTPTYQEILHLTKNQNIQFQYILGINDKVFKLNKITKHIPSTENHHVHKINSGHAMLTTVTARKLKEIRDITLQE